MSAALAFSHGANDAQKSIGVIAALLLAAGRIDTLAAPLWAKLVCAAALTVGTTLGGWRIIRTVGRGIYRIQAVDGLASQTASAGVILGASVVGAPVSTTQVVASSVIGVGVGAGAGTTCAGRSCARWAWRGRSRFRRPSCSAAARSSCGGGCRDEAAAVVPARDPRRARAPAQPGRGDAGGARRVRGVGRR